MNKTRYGNKSVVSRVVPDAEMPHTEDGKVVDVKLNLLAIMNRTTGFVPHELFITFICMRAREQMEKATTIKEKETILFNIIKDLNEKQYRSMYAYYKQLSTEEKREYLQSCIDNGIYIHQNPVDEDREIFYKLSDMKKKYSWLEPYQLYKNIEGVEYPQLTKTYLGQMYLIRLKQVDSRQFSARNTGAINTKELPERSYKNRSHQDLYSDTPIRFGEYETLGILTGLSEEELALFHAYYRTSIKGRRDLIENIFEPGDLAKIDTSLTSRVAEMFHVIFKSLALELEFIDEDNILEDINSRRMVEHEYKGEKYMMTDYEFYLFKMEERVKEEIMNENPMLTGDEINALLEKELNNSKRVIGEVKDTIFEDMKPDKIEVDEELNKNADSKSSSKNKTTIFEEINVDEDGNISRKIVTKKSKK